MIQDEVSQIAAEPASTVPADAGVAAASYQVLYDNAHMISELEARIMVLFWPNSSCLEVISRVLGVKEDTVRLYVDYRSLYVSVVSSADLTRLKKNRKAYVLDFLLARLALVHDSDDNQKWVLTLKAPKERKPSVSSPEGVAAQEAVLSSSSDAANKLLAEASSTKEKDKKRQEHQEELLKFLRDRPNNILDFDYDVYQKLKSEKSPRIEELTDLPVFADVPNANKQPGAVSNLRGKVWLGGNVAEPAPGTEPATNGEGAKSPRHALAQSNESSVRKLVREDSLSSVVTLPKIDTASVHSTDTMLQSASATTLPASHRLLAGNSITPTANRDEKHIYDFLTPGATRSSMMVDNSDNHSVHLPNIRGSMTNEEDMRKAIKSLADNFKPVPVVVDAPETPVTVESESTTTTPANKSSRIRRRSLGSAIAPIRMSVAMTNSIRRKASAAADGDGTNSTEVSTRGRNLRRSFGMEPMQNASANPPNQLPPLAKAGSNKSLHTAAGNVLLTPGVPVSSTTL